MIVARVPQRCGSWLRLLALSSFGVGLEVGGRVGRGCVGVLVGSLLRNTAAHVELKLIEKIEFQLN